MGGEPSRQPISAAQPSACPIRESPGICGQGWTREGGKQRRRRSLVSSSSPVGDAGAGFPQTLFSFTSCWGRGSKATDTMPPPAALGLTRCSLPSPKCPAKCVVEAALVFWLWQWKASRDPVSDLIHAHGQLSWPNLTFPPGSHFQPLQDVPHPGSDVSVPSLDT